VLLLLVVLVAGPAGAQSVSESELRALAGRAAADPRALAELRGVRQVDGRPVDLRQALDGADGPALAARLRTLAEGTGGRAVVAGPDARAEAANVLDGRRFKPSRVPRPLAGVLRTLGRWLQPLADRLGALWKPVSGNLGAQLAVLGVVFLGAALISFRLIGRRSPRSLERLRRAGAEGATLDPDDLEREAAAAEAGGDLATAVRLRFVAGVLRLDRAGVLSYRSSLTTGQLRARLGSTSFAELAAAFDEIAYGGRPAEASDVAASRTGWPKVLAEARR
jgi:hypothetical protein